MDDKKDRDRGADLLLWLALALLIGFGLFVLWALPGAPQAQTIPYSQFLDLLDHDKVEQVMVGETTLTGTLSEALPSGLRAFETVRVAPDVARDLSARHIPFGGVTEPGWASGLVGWFGWFLILFAAWSLTGLSGMRTGGGLLSIGRSKAKLFAETGISIRFDDVAGVDEAKEELREVVDFLQKPGEFSRLGAHVPKGILLVGPPGTGKTLLARAVAGEAKVPFISTNGSEFVEMFVGVGAARVRDLFTLARSRTPAIIFVDELDALGRARGSLPMLGGHDEKEQTLNQLLAELDGFDPSAGLVLLAATNRPEILNPALLRAGRFDRQILVDRPEKAGRAQILAIHTRRVPLAPDVDLGHLAALTPGFTGADLANLVNEAAMIATRQGASAVSTEDFEDAIERIVAGLEKKSRILSLHERSIVAHHEMGHALVAMAIPGADPVPKVSIIPRGIGALGYTIQRPTEDRFLMGRHELEDKMTVLMAGRAAERIVFGEVSTGGADDLAKVTDIARGMVMRYGMDETLGAVCYDTEPGHLLGQPQGAFWQSRPYGEASASRIDAAVRALVEAAASRASDILRRNHAVLEQGASRLLERETLTAGELPQPLPEFPGAENNPEEDAGQAPLCALDAQ
ncbi:ATP-dependent zinc metalloprotease FtsH [Azospirillum sp. YIM B02556]|uniref:ATP-dependent zinc metalloprotease FtsH n=1 Tax=Azospirillum endophyticum TaxID=2800326 RepID=A0ABS1FAQ4_9PROT|nr:ATP-dependent zinc metalloprotease FtsH [Azospirillum endophyticum]MBK1840518.1 ATP-dependent zinc metalloprotease FtsH [Azospirillum endophyticum]